MSKDSPTHGSSLPGSANSSFRPQSLIIVSGGQAGVDRAALDAAMESGVSIGGWCPEGRKAEDGPIAAKYPLKVLPGAGYLQRTLKNVQDSDGTAIIFFNSLRGGTKLTRVYCDNEKKPYVLIDATEILSENAAERISDFIRENAISVLNVAGPRASKEPAAYNYTKQAIRILLDKKA